ncbi:hypothetical protein CLV58_12561 [Spirosoma oryzae]|uniref:Uncharacterized protein n=1 Tax=Spirosoma oryzae TaxID=1469603 RepID=A0A2T0S8P7_9BACT|nr:hypothetical protein [Spirosoma oryzae]PRY29799.1 hypothetical protein CLV58_12561 [Spirosoma oryzae]
MITNPYFNPYNAAQQYRPGMQSSLALALMPTDNFAQKRADAAATFQYAQYANQLAEQDAAQKDKALADTQATLDAIDKQGLLQTDTRRLNAMYTERWRKQIEDEIKNNYGGDIVRFQRERQPYLVKSFLSQLQNAPEFADALENKVAYAQIKDAQAKGKLLIGNTDQDWRDYQEGRLTRLPFRGAYDAPKEGFDYFDKNVHPTAPYGTRDGKAIEVSQQDLLNHLLSQGMTPQQATDYVGKLGYRGGRFWKMESQKPWDAQKTAFDQNMDIAKFKQTGASQAETARHNRAMEAHARRTEKQNESSGGTGIGNLTTADILFNPRAGGAVQDNRYGRALLVTKGVSGEVADQAMRSAGIDPRNRVAALDRTGQPELNGRQVYQSNVKEVYTLDGKQRIRSEKPIIFQRVDASEIIHDPVSGQPFIKGSYKVAGGEGQEREVLIPLAKSVAAYASANAQSPVNDSKAEAAQNASSLNREAARQQQRTGNVATVNDILNSTW